MCIRDSCKPFGIFLGSERDYGVGMFFFPQDELKRNQAKNIFEVIVEKEGMESVSYTHLDVYKRQQYIRIIIMGTAFISLYNYSANILRAVGESRIPLLCLAVAVILNIFLDILFVHTFSMGLRGAAHATNIAQCIAGVLCMASVSYTHLDVYKRQILST